MVASTRHHSDDLEGEGIASPSKPGQRPLATALTMNVRPGKRPARSQSRSGATRNASRRCNREWEPADKPGSVVSSHSSGPCVAARFKRPTRERRGQRHGPPIRSCSRWGLPCHAALAPRAVRSYRTVSPLPRVSCDTVRRFVLCCTFRRLAPPRRYLAPCPVEPGLSSARRSVTRLPGRLPPQVYPACEQSASEDIPNAPDLARPTACTRRLRKAPVSSRADGIGSGSSITDRASEPVNAPGPNE